MRRYRDHGIDGLDDMKPITNSAWNKIPALHRTAIIDLAMAELPDLRSQYNQFQDSFVLPFDGHYNSKGHSVMVNTVCEHLDALRTCTGNEKTRRRGS